VSLKVTFVVTTDKTHLVVSLHLQSFLLILLLAQHVHSAKHLSLGYMGKWGNVEIFCPKKWHVDVSTLPCQL